MNTIGLIHRRFSQSGIISTDSRNLPENCVFFAIKGERFDGNDFVKEILRTHKSVTVVADRPDLVPNSRLIKVNNSVEALQQLANFHRNKMIATVVAITGTNGKTTTKELVSAVLSKKYKTIATQGNFNNHIGVPLTLLSIKPDTEMAVVEMGANHPNEIQELCNIAQPDFGIITNIGKAHLEGFGSFQGVINTKRELYNYINFCTDKQTVFVNRDNNLLMNISAGLNRYTYGTSRCKVKVNIHACDPFLEVEYDGTIIKTNLIGDYNIENVSAAIAIGKYFKVPKGKIVSAIENYHPSNNRSQIIDTTRNKVIMDSYNANPTSMQHAIANFSNLSYENKVLILGDMLELGDETIIEHQALLNLIKQLGFKEVYLIGKTFNKIGASQFKTFANVDAFCKFVTKSPILGQTILVKGSRGIQLEKTYQLL